MPKLRVQFKPQWMRLLIASGMTFCIGLISSSAIADPTYTVFSISEAKLTFAGSINSSGYVAGIYELKGEKKIGYIRSPDGTIISYQCSEGKDVVNAFINDVGEVAGRCSTHSPTGYLRALDGTIKTIQVGKNSKTFVEGFNNNGDVTGFYEIKHRSGGGFIYHANGKIETFNVDNGTTAPSGINSKGDIVGTYTDQHNVWHGFVRSSKGVISVFDAPGAGTGTAQGTVANAINAKGVVTGVFRDSGSQQHSFIRSVDGQFTTFDADHADAINKKGQVAGVYQIGQTGFVRSPGGEITPFNVPSKTNVNPKGINDAGLIVGECYPTHKHEPQLSGFIRTP